MPNSDLVTARMQAWVQGRIVVPTLWEYEVVSTLRKAVTRGLLTQAQAYQALDSLMKQELEQVYPNARLERAALAWADALGHSNAYDGQYLALAEHLGVDFWTTDRRLADSLQAMRESWVHWVGEDRPPLLA